MQGLIDHINRYDILPHGKDEDCDGLLEEKAHLLVEPIIPFIIVVMIIFVFLLTMYAEVDHENQPNPL